MLCFLSFCIIIIFQLKFDIILYLSQNIHALLKLLLFFIIQCLTYHRLNSLATNHAWYTYEHLLIFHTQLFGTIPARNQCRTSVYLLFISKYTIANSSHRQTNGPARVTLEINDFVCTLNDLFVNTFNF